MQSGSVRTEVLPQHFCGNFPTSHLPLKLYSRLTFVLLVTCGFQIFSAREPLNICDGVSAWRKERKKKRGGSTSNSTKNMSKLCTLLQPMPVSKIRSLQPPPLKTCNELHIRLYRALLATQVQWENSKKNAGLVLPLPASFQQLVVSESSREQAARAVRR